MFSLTQKIRECSTPEPNTGCWLWDKSVFSNGYGQVSILGRTRLAHRLAYEAFAGPIGDGLDVCHTCDVPSCVNPDHLFLGTRADNMQDASAKGRTARGDRDGAHGGRCGVRGISHGRSKLTPDNVRDVRRRTAAGAAHKALAREYGVAPYAIKCAALRLTWKDI